MVNDSESGSSDRALVAASDVVKLFRSRGIRRSRPVLAVDGVSVEVRSGQTVAVVGESGCGKSTLLRLLLNLQEPDAGTVTYRDRPLPELNQAEMRDFRRSVQVIFQHPQQSFNPMLSIGASLKDSLRLRDDINRRDRDAVASELLTLVGLDPSVQARRRSALSGGELQRVALARALATRPRAVLLDEPTSALDASVHGQIVELLLKLQREAALGYLLVTHDMRLVRMMANHVLVMYLGHVVEEGGARDVLERPTHPYTRSLVGAAALDRGGLKRTAIRGEVTELDPSYQGCRFAPRCPFVIKGCEEPQALRSLQPDRRVRCWRAEELPGHVHAERTSAANSQRSEIRR